MHVSTSFFCPPANSYRLGPQSQIRNGVNLLTLSAGQTLCRLLSPAGSSKLIASFNYVIPKEWVQIVFRLKIYSNDFFKTRV